MHEITAEMNQNGELLIAVFVISVMLDAWCLREE